MLSWTVFVMALVATASAVNLPYRHADDFPLEKCVPIGVCPSIDPDHCHNGVCGDLVSLILSGRGVWARIHIIGGSAA